MDITGALENSLFQSKNIKEIAKKRLSKCKGCPLNIKGWCSKEAESEVVIDFEYKGEERKKGEIHKGCGCLIALKKNSKQDAQCPLGKWEEFKYIK